MKWSMRKKIGAILFYCIVQFMIFHGVARESEKSRLSSETQTVNKVRLSLKTNKNKYKLGEPVQLSIQLENIGNKPIYIHFALALDSHISGSYLRLDIFTSDGKPVPYVQSVGDSAPVGDYPKGVEEIIRAHYHLINPQYFYGRFESIYPEERGVTKPGKYKLVLTYYDSEPTRWSPEEKADLKFYVLGGKLKSNEAWIEIVP